MIVLRWPEWPSEERLAPDKQTTLGAWRPEPVVHISHLERLLQTKAADGEPRSGPSAMRGRLRVVIGSLKADRQLFDALRVQAAAGLLGEADLTSRDH